MELARSRRELIFEGEATPLTRAEFEVAAHLACVPSQTASRSEFIAAIWGMPVTTGIMLFGRQSSSSGGDWDQAAH